MGCVSPGLPSAASRSLHKSRWVRSELFFIMPNYFEIAVNIPQISGTFHYHLPAELEGKVGAGHLVEAPFGRQVVQGVVLREVAEPEVEQTRAVIGLLDPDPVFTPAQLSL